jgi:TonB-dependent SusC/RagA subfamily outer membrane receptor
MSSTSMFRLLHPAAALLAAAMIAACGGTTPPAGQPAPADETSATGAGDVLTRAEIDRINPTHMADLLDGRFPGVQVVTLGGRPTVVIRGRTNPLIVVDGVPLADSQGIWSLSPTDIEQVQILKGAETARYGIQGTRGVVLITTRRS